MRAVAKVLIPIVLIICWLGKAIAYDNKLTHRDLSSAAAKRSGIESFLLDLGIKEGLNQPFRGSNKTTTAELFLEDGAELEDAGSDFDAVIGQARFKNHFHDPLKNWAEAGLSDLQNGMSMVLWAQDSLSQAGAIEGDYSWHALRNFYYGALIGKDDNFRQENFAQLFKGLGHQIHLIQDSGQPDHVRNDAHPLDGKGLRIHDGFEKWAKEQRDFIKYLASSPDFPQISLQISHDGLASITQLVDANVYTGSNPSASLAQGLAEYANANFYTDDTIFAAERFSQGEKHYFPYPKMSSTNVQEYIDGTLKPYEFVAPDGSKKYSIWIKKERDGETIDHLLRGTSFSKIVRDWFGDGDLFRETFYRDEMCHIDYAKKLIPRTVGYSAALINYFFRGQMETTALEKMDDNGNVTELLVNVRNSTSNETMKDGYFTLSYWYKPNGSDQYVYGTNGNIPSDELATGSGKQLSFAFDSPVPPDATEKQYTLVFHDGTLGAETGAVVGKVVDVTPAEIAITAPEWFVYAIVDDGGTSTGSKEFKKLRARLRDNAPEIEMTGGSVTARAKYKLHLSHMDDLSTEPPYAEDRSYDFYTSTSLPVEVSLDNLNSTEIEFDFSANPIPFGVTDLTLEATYTQGDTVIAFGAKDLNEPQYIGVWNAHDRFLIDLDPTRDDDIHDWRLMTESEIMDDPALVDMLDTDNGGFIDEIIDAVPVDFDVFFSAVPTSTLPETYHATFGNVPAGRYGRVAILTDQPYFYTLFHEKYTSSLPDSSAPGDYLDYEGKITYVTPGVTNQENDGTYFYTPIYSFRGANNHFSFISVGVYPEPSSLTEKAIAIKEANWPAPAGTAPVPAAAINP